MLWIVSAFIGFWEVLGGFERFWEVLGVSRGFGRFWEGLEVFEWGCEVSRDGWSGARE
jgi:hypothetical protein